MEKKTPYYSYDALLLRRTLQCANQALKRHPSLANGCIHYAVKANNNPDVLRTIASEGFGADCVSGGEICQALEAGFQAANIAYAGVGKTDDEIRLALNQGIGCFNVESVEELEIISQIAVEENCVAKVAFRINPNIGAHTHANITTGLAENKFGINLEKVPQAVEVYRGLKNLELVGIHFHIGSQILDMGDFQALCNRVNEQQAWFRSHGIKLTYINVGGGLGIDYEHPELNPVPDFEAYFSTFAKYMKLDSDQKFHCELGRAIVAQCGSLITRCIYVKSGTFKKFVIVDAGMNDLIRPALYHAYHKIENISNPDAEPELYDVVGPICESSDCFAKGIYLPHTKRGDLIAIRSAGAYGESMSSTYNSRPLARSEFKFEPVPMKAARLLSVLVFCLVSLSSYGQFNISENDAASTRWYSIRSNNFRMIYPEGCDSLSRAYLEALERYRPLVAPSIGMVSGQFQSRPLDVILHTRNSASNGLVSWTPSRMEMNTIPQWKDGNGIFWVDALAVHEGRHAAQMQMGYRRIFRPFRYILGQVVPGVVTSYPGSLLLEGDAVVAETALTGEGRGRDPHFIGWYIYSLDNGAPRSYPKWRFGSYYRPTPNLYSLGYAMISGMRTLYDKPYFMADYMDYVGRRPYDPWPLRHAMRRASGVKFKESFSAVMDLHYREWAADTLERGPFIKACQVSEPVRRMVEYSNPRSLKDGRQIWVKQDIYRNNSIIALDSAGREKRLAAVPSYMGRISYDGEQGRLFWNEVRYDPRWHQMVCSVIREYDFACGKTRTLTREGNLVSPVPFDDKTVAAVSYLEDGSEKVVFLDRESGAQTGSYPVPGGLQVSGIAVLGQEVYAVATNRDGMGIWRISGEGCSAVLPNIPVMIKSLTACTDSASLLFESNHNGSWELYCLNPADSAVVRLSSTRYGGKDFTLNADGTLSYSTYKDNGIAVFTASADEVLAQGVDWSAYHHFVTADSLAAQEDTLVFDQRLRHPRKVDLSPSAAKTEAVRYRKAAHGFRFHSWAPLYVDADAIDKISMASVTYLAHLGAVAFFQNSSSTLSGQIGYKAAPDQSGRWNHSGHLKLTYKGLYPVFDFQLDVNDRLANEYVSVDFMQGDQYLGRKIFLKEEPHKPLVSALLRSYIPLQWAGSQWSYGVVPSVSVRYLSDVLDGMHSFVFDAGVRAYALNSVPKAGVYPRWGGGAELRWLDPYALVSAYAYLPGACCGQGIRLSAAYQTKTPLQSGLLYTGGYMNVLPRGFQDVPDVQYREGVRLSIDYAAPFYMGDWHIGSAFLCTRGIITPHFDYTLLTRAGGELYSAGAAFELEFGSFFWIKTPVRIGVTYSYNNGSQWRNMGMKSHHYAGLLFNIQIPN